MASNGIRKLGEKWTWMEIAQLVLWRVDKAIFSIGIPIFRHKSLSVPKININ